MRKVEIVNWRDIRLKVLSVNKPLATLIDEMNPPDTFKLIKVTYQYGDLIVKDGVTYLPYKADQLLPMTSSDMSNTLKNHLDYSQIPLFLTLKNDHEVFINSNSRIIPRNLFCQGSLLGLFETIDYIYQRQSNAKWSVSSGVRSIIMLPKVANALGLNRLRRQYHITSTMPLKSLSDHWAIFVNIVNHCHIKQPWHSEVLFFTKDWIKQAINNLLWSPFTNYLFKEGWHYSYVNKVGLALSWESLIEIISLRNLKPRPYLADHVKHILSIAVGESPAFRPACSATAAPIDTIKRAFVDVYQIKDYLPTLMHLAPLDSINKGYPLYYSLSFPTLLEGSPLNKNASTIITDLRSIKLLIDTLQSHAYHNHDIFADIASNVNVSYFHVEKDIYGEVASSSQIPLHDADFLLDQHQYPNRSFGIASPFLRGCIKIQKKIPNKLFPKGRRTV